jgi:hypothetical protein
MTYPSIWLDLPVIGSFAALSYYLKLYQKEDECEMLSFFTTSVTILLMLLYSITENCIVSIFKTTIAHEASTRDAVIFTVNELDQEEQDGTPLPPDSKSGIRVDTDQVGNKVRGGVHINKHHHNLTGNLPCTGVFYPADLVKCLWSGTGNVLHVV